MRMRENTDSVGDVDELGRVSIPSVFFSAVIVFVLALVAAVTPHLVRHGSNEAGTGNDGETGESLELHVCLFGNVIRADQDWN